MKILIALWLSCVTAMSATIYPINIGSAGNDGTGDTLRSGFAKVNTNFANINNAVSNLVAGSGVTTIKTNGVTVSASATSFDIITGSNTLVKATNTAGAVTLQINSTATAGGSATTNFTTIASGSATLGSLTVTGAVVGISSIAAETIQANSGIVVNEGDVLISDGLLNSANGATIDGQVSINDGFVGTDTNLISSLYFSQISPALLDRIMVQDVSGGTVGWTAFTNVFDILGATDGAVPFRKPSGWSSDTLNFTLNPTTYALAIGATDGGSLTVYGPADILTKLTAYQLTNYFRSDFNSLVVHSGTNVVSGALRLPAIATNSLLFVGGQSNVVGLGIGANLAISGGNLVASGGAASTNVETFASGSITAGSVVVTNQSDLNGLYSVNHTNASYFKQDGLSEFNDQTHFTAAVFIDGANAFRAAGDVFAGTLRVTNTITAPGNVVHSGTNIVSGVLRLPAVATNTILFHGGASNVVGIGLGANLSISGGNLVAAGQASSMVLSNLVGTVARNVTNVVSLSTSNATSKPLTNAYASGVVTLFGLEQGANITLTPNGSNIVIASTASGSSGGTNYPPVIRDATGGVPAIALGSGVRRHVTIATNASLAVNFTGTALNGETVRIGVSNYSTSAIRLTNWQAGSAANVYQPRIGGLASTFTIGPTSISTFEFVWHTNFNLGTVRQELQWDSGYEYRLAAGATTYLGTNAGTVFVEVKTNQTFTSATIGTLTNTTLKTDTVNISGGVTQDKGFTSSLGIVDVASISIDTGGTISGERANFGRVDVRTNLNAATVTVTNSLTAPLLTAGQVDVRTNLYAATLLTTNISRVALRTNEVGVSWDYGLILASTNGAGTNILVSFAPQGTNHIDIYTTNTLSQFTNITGLLTGTRKTKEVRITPSAPGQNLTMTWPVGSQHGIYRWMTNANSVFWSTLTNGKTYVVSMTAYGTNIHSTLTLWEP